MCTFFSILSALNLFTQQQVFIPERESPDYYSPYIYNGLWKAETKNVVYTQALHTALPQSKNLALCYNIVQPGCFTNILYMQQLTYCCI